MRKTIEERFWKKVLRRSANECWPWVGAKFHSGYGAVTIQGKTLRAHRVAWALTNGVLPAGIMVLHTCDNPPCCNPAHLWLGNGIDNMQDAKQKGRVRTGKRTGKRPVLPAVETIGVQGRGVMALLTSLVFIPKSTGSTPCDPQG